MTRATMDEFCGHGGYGGYCGHCGRERQSGLHDRCDGMAALEPPRYCVECRRRMVVQVTPTGWTARCSRHGEVSSDRT